MDVLFECGFQPGCVTVLTILEIRYILFLPFSLYPVTKVIIYFLGLPRIQRPHDPALVQSDVFNLSVKSRLDPFALLTAPLRFWCRTPLALLDRLLIDTLVAVTSCTRRKGALCTVLFFLSSNPEDPVMRVERRRVGSSCMRYKTPHSRGNKRGPWSLRIKK